MTSGTRPLAIVTGASSGIGYELAKCYAGQGFNLLIAADQPSINNAAQDFRAMGITVEAVEADLSTLEGVDKLYAAPMRGTGWDTASSTSTSVRCRTLLTQTLLARSTCSESRARHACPRAGPYPHHWFRGRLHARQFPGSL
jgi:short chain dehydrogenase